MSRTAISLFLVAMTVSHGARAVNDPVGDYLGGLSSSGGGLRIHENSNVGNTFDFSNLAARLAASGSVNSGPQITVGASGPSERSRNLLELVNSGRRVSMGDLLKNLLASPQSPLTGTASEVASAMQSIAGSLGRSSPSTASAGVDLAATMDSISNMIGIPAGRAPKEEVAVPDMSGQIASILTSQWDNQNGGLHPAAGGDKFAAQVGDNAFAFSGLHTLSAANSDVPV